MNRKNNTLLLTPPSLRWPQLAEFFPTSDPRSTGASPQLRTSESPEGWQVCLPLPGLRQDQLQVGLKGRLLTIEVTAEEDQPFVGSFRRVLQLPRSVAASAITADLVNGLLTITLPKEKTAQLEERTIAIGSGTPSSSTQAPEDTPHETSEPR